MRPNAVQCLALGLLGWVLSASAALAQRSLADGLKDLADQITHGVSSEKRGSIAVLSFRNLDGDESMLGAHIAETMTTYLFQAGYRNIIERSMLDRAMSELKLGQSGLIDKETAKKIGKFVSADYVVAGVMTDLSSQVSLNCRMIEVQTGQIVAVAQTNIVKDDDVKKIMDQPIRRADGGPESPGPSRQSQGQVQSVAGISFRLQRCARNGTSVKCDLSATAEAKDVYFCCFQQSHLIDRSGHEYSISHIAFGKNEGTSMCTDLARGVPLAGQVYFEGIPLVDRDAALLELFCNFKVQFRDVAFK
jgi:TolB-like protein